MKKRIVLLSLLAVMVLSLCGCSDETTAANKSDNTKNTTEDEPTVEETYQYQAAEVYNYVDPETGVCYLLYGGYRAGGMTVRYNTDGSIMVKQQ